MKITLLLSGKTDKSYLDEGIKIYSKRLIHYLNFEIKIIPELKKNKKLTFEQHKENEGKLILKQLKHNDYVILLDENGKEFSSEKFSKFIEKKMINSVGNIVFIVGGPYGFSKDVYEKSKEKIALSKMTFSHQMVRLIFVEQLYRAMSIIKGEPYHHS